MSFEFGDVVLVPFPFTDQSTSKKRPAAVISCAAYNAARPDIVFMAITSQLRAGHGLGDVTVEAWREAGLLKPSAIKPIIATLEKSLVRDRLGRLAEDDLVALRAMLSEILG